jgi:hypothetical protein
MGEMRQYEEITFKSNYKRSFLLIERANKAVEASAAVNREGECLPKSCQEFLSNTKAIQVRFQQPERLCMYNLNSHF